MKDGGNPGLLFRQSPDGSGVQVLYALAAEMPPGSETYVSTAATTPNVWSFEWAADRDRVIEAVNIWAGFGVFNRGGPLTDAEFLGDDLGGLPAMTPPLLRVGSPPQPNSLGLPL